MVEATIVTLSEEILVSEDAVGDCKVKYPL